MSKPGSNHGQPPSHPPGGAGLRPADGAERPAGGAEPPAKGSRSGRVIGIVFVAIVVVIASWLIIDSQRGSIQVALHSWDDPVGDVMPVTVEVNRAPDITLTCELVAVDDRAIVVGQLSLEIPSGGESRQRISAEIPLRGDGIAPKLRGCSTGG